MREEGVFGNVRLDAWVTAVTCSGIDSLKSHYRVTSQGEVIDRLVTEALDRIDPPQPSPTKPALLLEKSSVMTEQDQFNLLDQAGGDLKLAQKLLVKVIRKECPGFTTTPTSKTAYPWEYRYYDRTRKTLPDAYSKWLQRQQS